MRFFGLMGACCLLAGCGAPQGGGSYGISQSGDLVTIPAKPNWDIQRKVDRMTDKPVTTVLNTSKTAKITSKPGFAASILTLNCTPSGGPQVGFYWGFPVGRNGASVVQYRFDALPAQKPKGEFLNMETLLLLGPEGSTFLHQLGQSTSLLVEISSVTGVATAEFDTSGAEGPLAELATCLQGPVAEGSPQARKPAQKQ